MFFNQQTTGLESQRLTSGLLVIFLTIKTILHFFGMFYPRLLTFGLLEKLNYRKTPVSQNF
jgi:hypothetical protein